MRHILALRCAHLFLFILCLVILSASPLAAADLRVAVMSPHHAPASPAQRHAKAALQFLGEWAATREGVRRVDPRRTSAVFSWLTSGAFTMPSERFFPSFAAIQPIEAWIHVAATKEGLRFGVDTPDGAMTLDMPSARLGEFAKALREVRSFVETSLRLSPDPGEDCLAWFTSDTLVLTYYEVACLYVPWPENQGEHQLTRLVPFWSPIESHPRLAARVLDAVAVTLSSHKRYQTYVSRAITLGQSALPFVIGTPYEASAARVIPEKPEAFEDILIEMASRAIKEDSLEEEPLATEGIALGPNRSHAQSAGDPAGAIRLMQYLDSEKSLQLLATLSKAHRAPIRAATATALGSRKDADAIRLLEALCQDADPATAFIARMAMWKRVPVSAPPAPAPLAEARALLKDTSYALAIADLLAAVGEPGDVAALRVLGQSLVPEVRRVAWRGLLRLEPANIDYWQASLADVDQEIMKDAIDATHENVPESIRSRIVTLCNDPQAEISESARAALQRMRPADAVAAKFLDLETEHPMLRRRLLENAMKEPDGRAFILRARSNPHAGTRAFALTCLAELDISEGRKAAVAALADPHRRVRLIAADILHRLAESADATSIEASLEHETDPAIASFLAATMARLGGKQIPAAPGPRRVADYQGLTWMCGMGADVRTSPYTAYYNLGIHVDDRWKAAYEAGKICFGRITTVSAPGLILLDPAWEDRAWILTERALPPEALSYVDGIVFGEETMDFSPDALWTSGWRLFCMEARLDPATIAADMAKLTPLQRKAWTRWAGERQIDGFNALVADTRLRWKLLRPGLQIATFMTEQCLLQSGPNPADLRWDFDVGGIYDYKGSNRMAYLLIRRIKTLWPERPIIWLSLGIGGYEMNPVKYNLAVPTAPIVTRADRAYADSASAWLAGADPGWFSTWIFVKHDYDGNRANLSGTQIMLEDISVDSPLLARGINGAFNNVDKLYAPKTTAPEMASAFTEPVDDIAELDAADAAAAEVIAREERIASEKERMRDGFLFYRHYIDGAVRLFASLPRRSYRSPFLGVKPGISVWSRTSPWADAAGIDLLSECDFLCDLNKLPEIGAARYRYIAIDGTRELTDATIAALTAWLRDTPGLLVVQGWLPTDNAAEVATVSDMDGQLANDWPWEKDINATLVDKPVVQTSLALEGTSALTLGQGAIVAEYEGSGFEPLWKAQGKTVAALWRKEGFKGAVIFSGITSASGEYPLALRARIHMLATEGIGLALPEESMMQAGMEGTIHAGASSPSSAKAARAVPFPGIDFLTGVRNPRVGAGRAAAITADEYSGNFIAVHAGIVIASDAPLAMTERTADGCTVTSTGLMQISGGALSFTAGGAQLDAQKPDAAWLFHAKSDGVAVQTWKEGEAEQKRYFVRSAAPVRITRAAK